MILTEYDDPEILIKFRTILDGVREMLEYGHPIAVIAINSYLEKPTRICRPAPPAWAP